MIDSGGLTLDLQQMLSRLLTGGAKELHQLSILYYLILSCETSFRQVIYE